MTKPAIGSVQPQQTLTVTYYTNTAGAGEEKAAAKATPHQKKLGPNAVVFALPGVSCAAFPVSKEYVETIKGAAGCTGATEKIIREIQSFLDQGHEVYVVDANSAAQHLAAATEKKLFSKDLGWISEGWENFAWETFEGDNKKTHITRGVHIYQEGKLAAFIQDNPNIESAEKTTLKNSAARAVDQVAQAKEYVITHPLVAKAHSHPANMSAALAATQQGGGSNVAAAAAAPVAAAAANAPAQQPPTAPAPQR